MPSRSRVLFRDKLLPDVQSIDDTHRQVNPDGHGRRKLGHLTRSGVVMFCAAWELYIEEVLVEATEALLKDADTPDFLPNQIKGRLCQFVKNDKHAFAALNLCGLGWKQTLIDAVKADTDRLNTPKFGNIEELFKTWLALDALDANWRHTREQLNEFVTLRGEVSHRGADARYVRITELREYKNMIDDLVIDTDRTINDHVQQISSNGRKPWRR